MVEWTTPTGYEVYEPKLKDYEKEIEQGDPIEIEVRDLSTFERKIVKAIVSKERGSIEGGVDLWFKDPDDRLVLEPGCIKIVEEINQEE